MEKEPITIPKTTGEKLKESFTAALMPAGIVLIVLLLLWIPFKVIPSIYGHGSNFVATALSSLFVSGDATSTPIIDNQNNVSNKSTSSQSSVNTNSTTNAGATYSNIQVQKVYYGKPDLAITFISTGIIDPASKQFIQTNYAGYNDEIGIKFEVKNIGTNVSGAWKLRINAPSRTTPYFDSDNQVSIKPGDKIVFTATFDSPLYVGINSAYITVDPLNLVDESSESNNLLNVPIKIEGTYYTYNNNYNYGSNSVASNLPYGTLYSWTNLNVSCYANPQTAQIAAPITWYASVSGGNGYYSYTWTGSDQLYSNGTAAVSKTYYSSGTKVASVIVTSGGQSITKQCSVNIF